MRSWRDGIRLLATAACAIVVAHILPSLIVLWFITALIIKGVLIRHERVSLIVWNTSVLLINGAFIVMCGLLARMIASLLETFGLESRGASLKIGFAVVAGAVGGAFVSGMLFVSLKTWQIDAHPPTESYLFWSPVGALLAGMAGVALARRSET